MTHAEMARDLLPLMGVPKHLIFPIFPLKCKEDYGVQEYPKAVQNFKGQWNIFTSNSVSRPFDPFTSREDLAELLRKLTEDQWEDVDTRVINLLYSLPSGSHPLIPPARFFLTATPAQVAEAVWRATCQ